MKEHLWYVILFVFLATGVAVKFFFVKHSLALRIFMLIALMYMAGNIAQGYYFIPRFVRFYLADFGFVAAFAGLYLLVSPRFTEKTVVRAKKVSLGTFVFAILWELQQLGMKFEGFDLLDMVTFAISLFIALSLLTAAGRKIHKE